MRFCLPAAFGIVGNNFGVVFQNVPDDSQAVELLSRQADIPAREKELIKAVPDMDMINTLVGTVKLSMPGLVKIKQDVRKNKKKK